LSTAGAATGPDPIFYADLRPCLWLDMTGHDNHCVTFVIEIEAWFQRPLIGNGLWGVEYSDVSRDRWCHVTKLKYQVLIPIRLKLNISKQLHGNAIVSNNR